MPGAAFLPVEPHTFLLLSSIIVLTAATPGPDFFYVASNALTGRLSAGLAACAGIFTGLLIYSALTALGLSVIFTSWPVMLSLVQWCGVLYLAVIGLSFFRAALHPVGQPVTPPLGATNARIFRNGIIINLLNPKAMLFFSALLPQFVDRDNGMVPLQMILLGLTAAVVGVSVYVVVAFLCARIGRRHGRWMQKPERAKALNIGAGVIYIGFAVALALWKHG